MTSSQEPAVGGGPVSRFPDRAYVELAPTLGELRARIDALDEPIVARMGRRAACVRDATRFKRDAVQVAGFVAAEGELFNETETIA